MQLGSSDVFGMTDNELTGENGHDLRFGLSSALRKISVEHNNDENGLCNELMNLDKKVWEAKVINDICKILVQTQEIFGKIGLVVI